MSAGEQRQAEELHTYLDALQAGEEPPAPPDVPATQAELLHELYSLVRTARPDPRFSQALERRLMAAAEAQAAPKPKGLGAAVGAWLGAVDRRMAVSLVGALAVIALFFVALAARGIELPSFYEGTRLAMATPSAVLTLWPTATSPLRTMVALAATATPIEPPTSTPDAVPAEDPTATLPPPTATLEPADASPTPLAATATVAPTTVSPIPAMVTATVAAAGGLGEPPRLPPLAAATCGRDCVPLPPQVAWTLDAPLPAAPAQVAAFLLHEPEVLATAAAVEMAASLGLKGSVYRPSELTQASAAPGAGFDLVAVDEPRQVAFGNANSFVYRDRSAGRASTLPEGEAVAAARAFLEAHGLLGVPYQTDYAAGMVSFYRLLDGDRPVHGQWARVEVGPAGKVAALHYRDLDLEQQQSAYPLRAAYEAWQQLQAGQGGDRAWYRVEERPAEPRTWERVYPSGKEAHLFGTPQVLLAQDGSPAHVTLYGLVLQGGVGALAEQQQAVQDHVWGEVQDIGSYQVLVVAGWEDASAQPGPWSGTLRDGSLITEDGQALPMPGLPTDLMDGTPISVHGGLVDGRLEWSLIEEQVESPAWCVEACSATVEEVALVYLVPFPDALSGEPSASVRALQPAWWFSALTDQGDRISVYVQAVPDAYVDTALGPVPNRP